MNAKRRKKRRKEGCRENVHSVGLREEVGRDGRRAGAIEGGIVEEGR